MRRTWAILAAAAVLFGACAPSPPPHRHLTGTTEYAYDVGPASATIVGRAGDETRDVFWGAGAQVEEVSEVCATWRSDAGPIPQEGLAVHVTGTTAVTLTKNVWMGAHWIFNVHTWGGPSPALIGAFDLEPTFRPGGVERPLPWRACLRSTATSVEFKAWPLPGVDPGYGTPLYGGRVGLPGGYSSGRPGFYAGHLNGGPDEQIVYTETRAT